MLIEVWLRETVDDFWAAAGGPGEIPRDLEEPVLWALPLAILKLPRLWVGDVEAWLEQRRIPFRFECMDRPLRGCLIAHAGKGVVLLDGCDSVDELRVSLAHEAAHFMVDYLHPRRRAIERLGEQIVEVLDGQRPPTIEERVSAILASTPIGVHTHLMDRDAGGHFVDGRTLAAESRADRLALELLAPADEVYRRVAQIGSPRSHPEGTPLVAAVLVRDFRLPDEIARAYARGLARVWYGEPSVRSWLGIK